MVVAPREHPLARVDVVGRRGRLHGLGDLPAGGVELQHHARSLRQVPGVRDQAVADIDHRGRAAADIAKGNHVAAGVRAMVVPGSGLIRAQAEDEGLDRIFLDAGFEWREPGCSMCLGMNPDILKPGERCASTSNRNFEGRQGRGGRTHLMSPMLAAKAAITGVITR